MTKIMIVEDDNNLREIYGARLQAEGYEIVSAKDGEEALAIIVDEKPDLVLADIMMPKISGFDMLDIIRSTPETKNTRVIMLTALSQKEDQERGEKLGADRYLVKSQITLEDVVRVVSEVLSGTPAPAPITPVATQPEPQTQPVPEPSPAPTMPTGVPARPATDDATSIPVQVQSPAPNPSPEPPAQPAPPAQVAQPDQPTPQPPQDPTDISI